LVVVALSSGSVRGETLGGGRVRKLQDRTNAITTKGAHAQFAAADAAERPGPHQGGHYERGGAGQGGQWRRHVPVVMAPEAEPCKRRDARREAGNDSRKYAAPLQSGSFCSSWSDGSLTVVAIVRRGWGGV